MWLPKSYSEEITGRPVSRMKRVMALLYSRLEVVQAFWMPLRKGRKRECGQRRARRIMTGLEICNVVAARVGTIQLGREKPPAKVGKESRA